MRHNKSGEQQVGPDIFEGIGKDLMHLADIRGMSYPTYYDVKPKVSKFAKPVYSVCLTYDTEDNVFGVVVTLPHNARCQSLRISSAGLVLSLKERRTPDWMATRSSQVKDVANPEASQTEPPQTVGETIVRELLEYGKRRELGRV
jgi:hypothetical protein